MDLNVINQLICMVKESGLSAIELEENGTRIRLENNHVSGTAVCAPAAQPLPAMPQLEIPHKAAEMPAEDDEFLYVTSPMVGIFCSLEKLGKQPLTAGDAISPETVVCAVEAMKMVCDIESELSGIYVETLAGDGEQVEYGQPLVKLRKA